MLGVNRNLVIFPCKDVRISLPAPQKTFCFAQNMFFLLGPNKIFSVSGSMTVHV